MDIQVKGCSGFNMVYGAIRAELETNITPNIQSEIDARISKKYISSFINFITTNMDTYIWIIYNLVISNTYVLVVKTQH